MTKVYVVFCGYYHDLDSIFEIKREAEEYVAYQKQQIGTAGNWHLEEWEVK
jgi:hypothetical protein